MTEHDAHDPHLVRCVLYTGMDGMRGRLLREMIGFRLWLIERGETLYL